jgi:hypothetical protein
VKSFSDIRVQLAAGLFEFSRHALRRAVERNISEAEIRAAERQKSSKITPMTSIHPAHCCSVLRWVEERCTCRYHLLNQR